jgi:hypothetical protein
MKVCSKCKIEKDEACFRSKIGRNLPNSQCRECESEYIKEYKRINKDVIRKREFARVIEYRNLHRDENNAKAREKYMSDKLYRERKKSYVSTHRDLYRSATKKYLKTEKGKASVKKYLTQNKDGILARHKRYRDDLKEHYIKLKLLREGWPKEFISSELIDLKKICIHTKRELKKINHGTSNN